MQNENTKSGELKALKIMHRAMLLGQVIFAVLAFLLNYSGRFTLVLKSQDQLLQVISILLSITGFFVGSSLFQKRMLQLRETSPGFKTKLTTYRSASLVQWALLEGASLFCIICFMLAGNYSFLGLAATLMLVFAIIGPTKQKMGMLLHLTEKEMDQL